MADHLRQLLDNPVLKENPACLGELLQSVVAKHSEGGLHHVEVASDTLVDTQASTVPIEVAPGIVEHVTPEEAVRHEKAVTASVEETMVVPGLGEASVAVLEAELEATIESQWRLDPGAGEVAAPSAGEVAQPGVAEVAQPGVAEVAVTPVVKTEPVPEPKANSAVEEALNRATTMDMMNKQPQDVPVAARWPGWEKFKVDRPEFKAPASASGPDVPMAAASPTSPVKQTVGLTMPSPTSTCPTSPAASVGVPPSAAVPAMSPAASVDMPPPVAVPVRRVSDAATPSPGGDDMGDDDIEALRALKNAYMRFYRSIKSVLV